eukprot:CAMPEP_0172743904 /NCGR_PEP_ID=MMETSP1074-20121228/133581_1 /TAXON_ID=2916 /ORGANISM="Ceratium fusus, Strain PA161109" /LENGTH=48 /DNA_ID= /DNA_START= /DNA_END= /DNA_ORIENTATION=
MEKKRLITPIQQTLSPETPCSDAEHAASRNACEVDYAYLHAWLCRITL